MSKKFILAHNIILYILFAIVVSSGVLYHFELKKPLSDTFKYYGIVTEKPSFTYPERIASITFGWAENEDKAIRFVNALWCAPIDSGKEKELIDLRMKEYDAFVFANILPESLRASIESEVVIKGQISSTARDQIRMIHAESPYSTWVMDDIRPNMDSDCYISAEVTRKTDLFGIEKTIEFTSHEFQYIVPLEFLG